jgi:hypothetical protein
MTANWTALEGVRAFYVTGEEITLPALPAGTSRVVARRARGDLVEAEVGNEGRFSLGLSGAPIRSKRWLLTGACWQRN